MKRLILSSLVVVGMSAGAFAQTSTTPPVAPKAMNAAAPVKGANSFTEAQAKDRIEKAGFTSVSALTKDDNGIWRGKASKSGGMVEVALDYQGNVTSK
ncbi:hypothetical protein SAMN05444161_8717 [Rhizobiales bacterium GAS191]|jgi:hypothetical protein|nr:hypothetical protein SAMN05519103_03339 [Rhizobiales bacterium GAS113]SDR63689.1 hypothetical protein SAMN05519103_08919 [Rhizobiales bacterium GAS113]SEF12230.1 hypothetical protein SAMN05444161_8717 [Rhizobiales bacterium GAS191]